MKNLFHFIWILVVLVLLTSCAAPAESPLAGNTLPTNKPNSVSLYTVQLAEALESHVFKESVPFFSNQIASEKVDGKEITELEIGQKRISARLIERYHSPHVGGMEVYHSEDGATVYEVGTNNPHLLITSQNDSSPLLAYEGVALTEDALRVQAQTFISSYVPELDFDYYIYSISTHFVVLKENAAWGDTVPYFYEASDETEMIAWYTICFQHYAGHIATLDEITVNCDPQGNITYLRYYDYNVDWDSVSVDEEKMNDSIQAFLDFNIAETCTLTGYTLGNPTLLCVDGAVSISVTLTLSVVFHHSPDITCSVLCPLVLEL